MELVAINVMVKCVKWVSILAISGYLCRTGTKVGNRKGPSASIALVFSLVLPSCLP
jgi:hypothetical protein